MRFLLLILQLEQSKILVVRLARPTLKKTTGDISAQGGIYGPAMEKKFI